MIKGVDFLSVFAVLDPKGAIALAERGLMFHAVLFMLIVAVPVYILLFFFAWRYRTGNTKAAYAPHWEHSKMEELIWWAIPFEIILILGALTWTSTHDLDPRKTLNVNVAPLVIEVVALDWKWLFLYPEENIATVNYVRVPRDKPVRFDITADAPMNSFWIPELGGQIYAMTGMITSLNLIANEVGEFAGKSANYSGEGFAQMKFTAQATSQENFDAWVAEVKTSSSTLSWSEYEMLAEPSVTKEPLYYGSVEPNLYNMIVTKFTGLPVPSH
ncbi:ubiquinol oxidase subunit II [Candidatus Adlerbacteria bacterium RIFCSPLOWO2_01_FULL_51_16]|uniref:Ubiquinol oxidase polypeptide II n=1 Tax=Candidatus Adlerbacteria bacterium RIFCSPLOWO2_01_FULL_51_16 TaxID=1797243 RepID=A0A1F4XGR5_9BACT|nr:MAG: ubiquinol oxidase subunit II [Candidatus Adlerbacteria bacterium RIFCSPLOWO2_01_FULL_51_16]